MATPLPRPAESGETVDLELIFRSLESIEALAALTRAQLEAAEETAEGRTPPLPT